VYFRRNYDCQRFSFLKALSLITVSLIFINIRYGIEYIFIEKQILLQQLDYTALGAKNTVLIVLLVLSDFLPLVCMIACIQIGNKGKWDAIMAAYLRGPNEEDLTTECGSHMLDDLNKYSGGTDLDSLIERASAMPDDIHSLAGSTVSLDMSQERFEGNKVAD